MIVSAQPFLLVKLAIRVVAYQIILIQTDFMKKKTARMSRFAKARQLNVHLLLFENIKTNR